MKNKVIRLIFVTVFVLIAVSITVTCAVALHGTENAPILYYNDRAWSLSSRFPAEADQNGVYYIPLTVFVQLPEVDVRINETLQTFIITHKKKYLSFDTATGYAANQDKMRFPLSTYERQGERYVPVETVCSYLGLGYEKITSPTTGDDALRITDGHQTYSFITLLRRKEPGFYAEETTPVTESAPETEPPETEPPALTERTIYITVEDSPGEYTDAILSVLADYGVKATFFVVRDRAAENITTISKIVAGGHSVALHTMSHDPDKLTDAEAVVADIEELNGLLSRTVKIKSRIWRAPDGSKKLTSLAEADLAAIEAQGYVLWDANVDVPTARSAQASRTAINGIWNNRVAILRFCESKYTADTLKLVLDYIQDNREVCELRVISGAFDPISD